MLKFVWLWFCSIAILSLTVETIQIPQETAQVMSSAQLLEMEAGKLLEFNRAIPPPPVAGQTTPNEESSKLQAQTSPINEGHELDINAKQIGSNGPMSTLISHIEPTPRKQAKVNVSKCHTSCIANVQALPSNIELNQMHLSFSLIFNF
jgi:hypothetical protein